MKQDVIIHAGDASLAATIHHDPGAPPADAVILLCGAMGLSHGFYQPFAEFFAGHGIDVLTWDYRGIGGSVAAKENRTQLHHWGERDLPAVIDWLRARYPQRRLVIVAHSVGGQILGMTPKAALADRVILIGSQSGYWRLWTGRQQLRIGFIWHFVIPVVTRLLGFFPARWFGVGENLPAGVAREWARWGRDPDYLMGRHRRASADNYATLPVPILNVWISDDDIATFAANRRMLEWYASAKIENLDLHPEDLNVDRIGHYRLFRETVGPKIWPRLLEWLQRPRDDM